MYNINGFWVQSYTNFSTTLHFSPQIFLSGMIFLFLRGKEGWVLRMQEFVFEETGVKNTEVKPYVLRSQKLRSQELSRMFCGLG